MTKVLFIQGTPQRQGSKSLEVAHVLLNEYKKLNPEAEVEVLDLYAQDMPEIDADVMTAMGKLRMGAGELTATEKEKLDKVNALVDNFISKDRYIIQSPMFNLGIPPRLKGLLDMAITAGKAFNYTEKGPVGILTDKKAVHIHGAGGVYSNGAIPQCSDTYIKSILGFAGMQLEETIWVEGVDYDPSCKDRVMTEAKAKAITLAAKL